MLRKSDPDIAMEALKQWERQGMSVSRELEMPSLGFRSFEPAESAISSATHELWIQPGVGFELPVG